MSRKTSFTAAEDQLILNADGFGNLKLLVERLGHSYTSVQSRRSILKQGLSVSTESKPKKSVAAPASSHGPFARPSWFEEDTLKLAMSGH